MAPEWEAMGIDLGIGVNTTTMPPPAPSSMTHFYGGDHSFFPPGAATPGASGSSSFNLSFADDFAIASEEAAELEWLSNVIDDSYPDMPNYPPEVAAAAQQQINKPSSSSSSSSVSSTGARTKRSRGTTSSWLLPSPSQTVRSSGGKKNQPPAPGAGPGGGDDTNNNTSSNNNEGGGVRRCTHCASEKTPQWRTGPLGPKTLCNACGVRYKSGRLVPEYRPAASPTFVLTQHSNSHRKVMELRRQKEVLHLRGAASGSYAAASFRDYGLC